MGSMFVLVNLTSSILASSARKASPKAVRANPRLKRVRGK